MKEVLMFLVFAVTMELAQAQGAISYGNRLPRSGIDAPVFDDDCQTRLEGPSYLAQTYVGITPEALLPLGPILRFGSGGAAGYVGAHAFEIPGVFNQLVYTQLRAWEAAAGPNYEAALAAGGKYGFSNIVPMDAVTGPGATADPVGLQSFCLIPEPPTGVLGLLGAIGAWAALCWRCASTRRHSL